MGDVSRGGAVWLARMAHNHQVAGSNPAPATNIIRRTSREVLLCCTVP